MRYSFLHASCRFALWLQRVHSIVIRFVKWKKFPSCSTLAVGGNLILRNNCRHESGSQRSKKDSRKFVLPRDHILFLTFQGVQLLVFAFFFRKTHIPHTEVLPALCHHMLYCTVGANLSVTSIKQADHCCEHLASFGLREDRLWDNFSNRRTWRSSSACVSHLAIFSTHCRKSLTC